MDEAIYLLKQADFLRSKVNNILVPTKWFSNEFIEKIPQCETLSFGFRGEEHDISTKQGFTDLLNDIIGMNNTFEESFILFGMEKSKSEGYSKQGITFSRLTESFINNFNEFSILFKNHASSIPDLSYGILVYDYKLFSCLRVRAKTLNPIKLKYNNLFPVRVIENNEVVLKYVKDYSYNIPISDILSKLPNKQTQKYIWFSYFSQWKNFVPNAHLMIDFKTTKIIHKYFKYIDNKEFATIQNITEFERYWLFSNQKIGVALQKIDKIIISNFISTPFIVVLFYPDTFQQAREIASLIESILEYYNTCKFICFTTSFWIEYNKNHRNSFFSFLNPIDEYSNNLLYSISSLCIESILNFIPSLNYPSNQSILSRIGCNEWNLNDEITAMERPKYEFLRGGDCLWSDRNLIEYPIIATYSIMEKIMNSNGICISHHSKIVAKSFAIHILALLSEKYKQQIFYFNGKDFMKETSSIMEKEIPSNSLLFIDQPTNINEIIKYIARPDIKLIITKLDTIKTCSLEVVEVPGIDEQCANVFSKHCLEINEDNFPLGKEVKEIHKKIIELNKQSYFLLSFTRFVAATLNPEEYIHGKISLMKPKEVKYLRLLAILGNIELSSNFIYENNIIEDFIKLNQTCSWIYIKEQHNIKYLCYWHQNISKFIQNLPITLQDGISNIQLFCEEYNNFEIPCSFWKQSGKGKPSQQLSNLSRGVESTECADSLIEIMERIDENLFYLEEEQYILSKIRVLLILYEKLYNKHSLYCETLRCYCLNYCEYVKSPYSNTMKGTVLFRTHVPGDNILRLLTNLKQTILPDYYHSLSQFPYWFGEVASELDEASFTEYLEVAVNYQYKLILHYPWHAKATTSVFKKFIEIRNTKNHIIDCLLNLSNNFKHDQFLKKHVEVCSLSLNISDYSDNWSTITSYQNLRYKESTEYYWVLCLDNECFKWKLLGDSSNIIQFISLDKKRYIILLERYKDEEYYYL